MKFGRSRKRWSLVMIFYHLRCLAKESLPVKNIGGGSFHPEFKDVENFYRIEIYYLILDTITQAIKDKLNENDLKILNSINNILVDKNPDVYDIQEVIVQNMDLM